MVSPDIAPAQQSAPYQRNKEAEFAVRITVLADKAGRMGLN
jgi:hypothetical protein